MGFWEVEGSGEEKICEGGLEAHLLKYSQFIRYNEVMSFWYRLQINLLIGLIHNLDILHLSVPHGDS